MNTAYRIPVLALATGFGVGYLPAVSGTAGTLVGIAAFWAMHRLPTAWLVALIILIVVFGVWLCGRAAEFLGNPDPKQVVWDEIAGICVVLLVVPPHWPWWLAGFALFRLFDITKPGLVGWAERRFAGGLGIMADDVVAGLYAAVLLLAARFLVPGGWA